jgi:hypothetical protein
MFVVSSLLFTGTPGYGISIIKNTINSLKKPKTGIAKNSFRFIIMIALAINPTMVYAAAD